MFYAQQSPRGFANETNTFAFRTRANRNNFVAKHCGDGDVNAASCGAEAISRRQAMRNVGYKGDAATQSYNGGLIDGDAELGGAEEYRYLSF